jgi:hypothetical protein
LWPLLPSNKAWARARDEWVKLRAIAPVLRTAQQSQELAFRAREFDKQQAVLGKQVVMPLDHTTVAARDFVADSRRRSHTCMVPEHQAQRSQNGWPLCSCWAVPPTVSGRWRSS